MMWWLALMAVACLEHVTGEVVPLDPRFTAQATGKTGTGTDTGGPAHAEHEHVTMEHTEVPPPQPFESVEGDRITVSGEIVTEGAGTVNLDVSRVDKTAPGGIKREGKLLFPDPGPFELQVPASIGSIMLVAFQDPDDDGPSETDHFGEVTIDVGTEPIADVLITLVKGARGAGGSGPVHSEAPPGHGSDQSAPPGGQPQDSDPFASVEGERVAVSGTLISRSDRIIDLDVFQPSESAPGGRILLGKLKRPAGAFALQVPISLQSLELDAFVDQTGDGPSADDPRGQLRAIDLTQGPVENLVLSLQKLTESEPEPEPEGGGTDLEEEFKRTASGANERPRSEDGL